jgi:hypothetical protein
MTELDDILEHIRRIRAEALEAVDALGQSTKQADEQSAKLESPKAVFEYIDVFVRILGDHAAELERVIAELPEGVKPEHLDALRQVA